MAIADDTRAGAHDDAHENARRYELAYPPGTTFAEQHMLSSTETRIATDRYTSPEFLAREIDGLWKRVWQMACREEEIPAAGDVVPYRVADQEYLVVRQHDGSVRAFHNVCRHRGNLLKRAPGSFSELRCSYHHWCWNLDGSLADIPDRHLFETVNDPEYTLGEIGCDTWGGFVFVHPGPADDRRPLTEFLGGVADQLAPYRFEDMVAKTHVRTGLACNWKVAVEAFLEVYHVQGIHPQLMPMLDDVNTAYEVIGQHSRMIVPFGVPSMRLDDVAPQEVFEAFLNESGQTGNTEQRAGRLSSDGMLDGVLAEAGDEPDAGIRAIRELLIERAAAKASADGHDFSALHPGQLVDDWHYHLFPGMVFNTHAGGFLLFRIRPDWNDPDRCDFDIYRFGLPKHDETPRPAEPLDVPMGAGSFGTVLDQDFENLPGVQRGLHSDGIEFVTVSAQEVRVAHLHAVLDRYL